MTIPITSGTTKTVIAGPDRQSSLPHHEMPDHVGMTKTVIFTPYWIPHLPLTRFALAFRLSAALEYGTP